ncbi:MAG: hypothetical protein IJ752_08315 [Alphaproteobacteria bacterium]|nr:hypothetical protein [Alphaproteobacteria bacterium]
METLESPHIVKVYESDRKGELHLRCLFNLFQDIADRHADGLGCGYAFCLEHGIGWVGANYHLRINRLPTRGESFVLTTWASGKTAVCGIRDFKAVSEQGEMLFYASSQWALVDLTTKRPVSVAKKLPDYPLHNERMIDTKFPAITFPEAPETKILFPVRYEEIDLNSHVNNAVYPVWAAEGVPHDFRLSHDIAEMEIAFKKPAVFDDEIAVFTQTDGLTTTHKIASPDKEKEFSRVRIVWKTV